MIKAEELRLFNIVGCKISNDHGFYNVIAFPEWTTEQHRPITINRCPKETMGIDKIKPIPLTEDWLIRFGCKMVMGASIKTYWIAIPNLKCELHFEVYEKEIVTILRGHFCELILDPLKFVHNFQNTYHCLSGTELELKSK